MSIMLSRFEQISTFKVNGYPCKGNNSSIYYFAFLLSGDRLSKEQIHSFNPIALKTAKTPLSFPVLSAIGLRYIGTMSCFFSHFYAPPQKVAGYYVIPSELLSVCPSVCPSVRPSAVEHSCPVHNFDTV